MLGVLALSLWTVLYSGQFTCESLLNFTLGKALVSFLLITLALRVEPASLAKQTTPLPFSTQGLSAQRVAC